MQRFFESEFGKQQMAASYHTSNIYLLRWMKMLTLSFYLKNKNCLKTSSNNLRAAQLSLALLIGIASHLPHQKVENLGMRPAKQLPSLFLNEASTMTVNEVRGPIKAGNGFHILKLIGQQGGQQKHLIQQSETSHILIRPKCNLDFR